MLKKSRAAISTLSKFFAESAFIAELMMRATK